MPSIFDLSPLPWTVDRKGGFASLLDASGAHVITYTNVDNGLYAAPGVLEWIADAANKEGLYAKLEKQFSEYIENDPVHIMPRAKEGE